MTGLSKDFFGATILGPIETNIGGSGKPLIWPVWNPTSWRAVDNFGGVPPGFTYLQGVSGWGAVETANGVYDWSLFDLVWAKLIAQGVNNVVFSFQQFPQWAQIGNAYSFASATVSAGTPCLVTAAGNQYQNGWKVFFSGGTLPSGGQLTLGTVYFVVGKSGNTFNLSLTSGGAAINTTGSGGTSTVTAADTPPASMARLTEWVTSYLTRATLDGLPIKFVEGLNEPNNGPGFFVGSQADLVAMQTAIYNAAKTYDPTIKVLSPPVNQPSVGAQTYLNAFITAGGAAFCDIIGFHGYPSDPGTASQSVYQTNINSMLAIANGVAKPLWNTEFSELAGAPAGNEIWLAATTFIDWSAGIGRKYYYDYDNGADALWNNPSISPPNGALNVAGVAQQQLIVWLTGATIRIPLALNGVIWTIDFMRANGAYCRAVWTSDGSTPSYPVPTWAVKSLKLDGSTATLGANVTLGALPIVLTNVSLKGQINSNPNAIGVVQSYFTSDPSVGPSSVQLISDPLVPGVFPLNINNDPTVPGRLALTLVNDPT